MSACSFTGCKHPRKAQGLCGGHYIQRLRRQELRPLKGAHGYVGTVRLSFSLTRKEFAVLKKMLPKNITPGAFLSEFIRDQLRGKK